MQPIVTLINPPQNVLETIYILWERSKTDGPTPLDPEIVRRDVPREKVEELFWQVLRQHIPIAEHIHFTFMLDGISVSLREQMVRHRIGTSVGPNFGVDIIPDLASSSWWSQSMRIQDMGTFADREMYRVPDTLAGKSIPLTLTGHPAVEPFPDGYEPVSKTSARALYHATMRSIQDSYKALVEAGVPMEDARELIPLGAQHSISWDLNLQSLLHILGKRGCWILQLGIWGPIIHGMINELAKKVHPMFARIIAPPCIDQDDNFKSCTYRLENARRMTQDDQHPPCPLWLCKDDDGSKHLIKMEEDPQTPAATAHLVGTPDGRRIALIKADDLVPRHREMKQRAEQYRDLWHHDPYTWAKE